MEEAKLRIKNWKYGEDLILNHLDLEELPPLPHNLTKLNCYNNKLTKLPILSNTLKELWCGNNKLTSLPTLPNSLQKLGCSLNKLTSLPTLPNSLQLLHCEDNDLRSLPRLPNNLQELDCRNNQLASLPDLPNNLQELDCRNNELTSLPDLPNSLQRLYCGDNQLTSLPDLPNTLQTGKPEIGLRELDCRNNRLKYLPKLPKNLESLFCQRNKLTSLPDLPNILNELDCRWNNITSIPNFEQLQLQELYIYGNPNLVLTTEQEEFLKNSIYIEDLIENKNKFIIFYEENIQKCFMDINLTYPINHNKLLEWVEEKDTIYPSEWRFKFNQNLQHISFQTFYEQCCKVAIELISTIQNGKFTNVYLYLPLFYSKSNLWVALLQWKFISNYITGIILLHNSLDEISAGSLIIYCDDCIYSGQQIYEESGIIDSNNKFSVYFSCPYITNKGLEFLSQEIRKLDKINLITPQTTNIITNTLDKSTFYFDHKLADNVSVYDELIIKFIKGCEDKKRDCPPPFYKSIDYTYFGTKLKGRHQSLNTIFKRVK